MSFIDWLVLVGFIGWVVWDGVRRSRGTKDLDGYFAGGRSIPWWAAGLSIMATQASAITVIGTTGQGHESGMEFVQFYFGLPFAMLVMCIVFVPFYRKNPILTAYEYLETRFGPMTRTLASLIFLVSRCLAFGVVIYAPAVVLSALLGVNETVTIFMIGALTTLYTMFGGIRAVIWTDVKQMVVIIGGLVLCFGILLWKILPEVDLFGGLRVLGAAGKMNALETVPVSTELIPRAIGSDAPKTFWEDKYNLWSGLIGGFFLQLAYFGADQSQVQRILTNPTANDSRRAALVSAFAKVPMQAFVLFIGVLLYLFHVLGAEPMLYKPEHEAAARAPENVVAVAEYRAQFDAAVAERSQLARELAALPDGPESDPQLVRRFQDAVRVAKRVREDVRAALVPPGPNAKKNANDTNYIFPAFILEHLPPFLLGLVVAAIFAAAMSSADSALNSLTSAAVVDFYRRWVQRDADDRKLLAVSRVLTVVFGAAATVAAWSFSGSGSVIEVVNKVGSYFYGSLLGIFVLAVVWRRAGPWAGVAGLVGGMVSVLVVDATFHFAYLWYNLIGCLGVLVAGIGVSFFEPRRA